MLFSIFFIYVNAKKNICVCNEICSPLCSSNTFIGSKFNSNLYKLLETESNEDNEIEIIFYSRTKYFNFIFNWKYFQRKELILTTLSDSNPIIIIFQNDSKISNDRVILYPNYQLFISPSSINYTNIKKITNPHYFDSRSNSIHSTTYYETISPEEATGNYSNNNYLNNNKISTSNFTFSSLGNQNNYPISNAFDGSKNTYWVSSIITNETTKDSIFINFKYFTCIEALIIQLAFSTNRSVVPNTRYYHGYPVSFNILSSLKDDEYELNYVVNGKPKDTDIWDSVQFIFPHPICCDNLKFELTEVTPNRVFSNYETKASVADFYLIQSQIPMQSPSPTSTIKPTSLNSQALSPEEATGNYSNNNYLNNNKISTTNFTFSSSGDQNNYPISNAFDGKQNTFWISSIITNETTKDSIFINFKDYTCIEAFVIYPAYTTQSTGRIFHGYPVSFNILSSVNDDEYELNYVVNGRPKDRWSFIQFVFPNPICCDNLKFEFTEVEQNKLFSNNETKATIGDFYLFQSPTPTPSQSLSPTQTIKLTPSQSQNKNDIEFSTVFNDDEVTKTLNNDDFDDKNTKYYSLSDEIIFDPSFHMISTDINSDDKSEEKSKPKKTINKTFIVMSVIAVEILFVTVIIISVLVIIIRNKDVIFMNVEDI